MHKKYIDINVLEASQDRIKYIFDNFDNVYISFSGGKDSGVLLHLVIDYIRANNIKKKVGVLFVDLEAFYLNTISFIEEIINNNLDIIEPYWVCLPLITVNAVSMYEPFWIFWDENKKDKWVRKMPEYNYVINKDNNRFDFYKEGMTFETFVIEFSKWYSRKFNDKIACLVGIRGEESLHRIGSILNDNKAMYNDCPYSTQISDVAYNFYPIYDWNVKDIWIYNSKYKKDYNKTYDLFFNAGVPLTKMRICEPYGNEQRSGLNLYKIIEPETWVKLVDRVSGANFGNIYCKTKIINSKSIKLPANHTWRSYCKFLLKTLPIATKQIYMTKFIKFIKYWHRIGCGIDNLDILKIPEDFIINTNEYSNRCKGNKLKIKFKIIPDELPGLDNKSDFLSWKRLCMCIIKNDILCESLSFSMTKEQIKKQNLLIEKYKILDNE